MDEKLILADSISAMMNAGVPATDEIEIRGHYNIECHDEHGNTLWSDSFDNTVMTLGKNQIELTGVNGTTPVFMGLIGAVTTAPVAGDTIGSHGGWLEAGAANAPTYSGGRPAVTWAAPSAGSIATNSTNTFNITGSGTINGGFVVFGTGALTTIANTGGTLMSAGTFVAQPVVNGNTVTMSYTLSM